MVLASGKRKTQGKDEELCTRAGVRGLGSGEGATVLQDALDKSK